MSGIQKYKPAVTKRTLLFITGTVWTVAGAILLYRGFTGMINEGKHLLPEIFVALGAGAIFYVALFAKISIGHTRRIFSIKIENPCLFSFFHFKGYLIMAVMITAGIVLRKSDIINHEILYAIFITMGSPLLISAWRFYYSWFNYSKIISAGEKI